MNGCASTLAKITERQTNTLCKLQELQANQSHLKQLSANEQTESLSGLILNQSWFPFIFGALSGSSQLGSIFLPSFKDGLKLLAEQGIPTLAKSMDTRFDSIQVQRKGAIELTKLADEDARKAQQVAFDALQAIIRTTNEAFQAERQLVSTL